MEEKKNNGLLVILVIIIAILVLIIGFLIGLNMNKDETKETKDNGEIQAVETEESLTSSSVVEANKLIPYTLCGAPLFPFEKKEIKLEDLSDEVKLHMIYHMYIKWSENSETTVTEDQIKKYFEDTSFLEKVKKGQYDEDAGSITYKDGKYVIKSYPTGCIGAYEGYTTQLIKATKKGDILSLTYAYYYTDYDYDKGVASLYKAKGEKAIYDNAESTPEGPKIDNKEVDYSPFDTYTFNFDTGNHNLRFVNMTYKAA